MHRNRLQFWRAAAIGVALLGCGGDGGPDASTTPTGPADSIPTPARVPAIMTRIWGDAQLGMLGAKLDAALIVQVLDAKGVGIAGVPVTWISNDGTALTCLIDEDTCQRESRIVHTNAAGSSSVLVWPAALHRGTVTAAVAATPTLSTTFTMETVGVLIRAQRLPSCDDSDPLHFNGHPGASHTVVPVGIWVEFEFADWLAPRCLARLVTTMTPAGDPGFDSGNLSPGQRFRFMPKVAGTWEFKDQYSGGVGWVTAGPLPSPQTFQPLSRPATVYNETEQLYHIGTDLFTATRFVFFEDGTFELQVSSARYGWGAYSGRYSTTDATIALAFNGGGPAGKWEATASLSGDTLFVTYNTLMHLDDFIDGRYVRAR